MQYLRPIGNLLSNAIVRWVIIISLGLGGPYYLGFRSGWGRGYRSCQESPTSSQYQLSPENGMGGGGIDYTGGNYGLPALNTPISPTYTVKSGDTIWSIAAYLVENDPRYRGYTTKKLTDKILELNPNINPKLMHRGNVLTLP